MATPEWKSRASLADHFRRHGAEVGARDVEAYLNSARETIRLGTRFTYQIGVQARVGYYDPRTRRFVAVDPAEDVILNHGRKSQHEVRALRGSDYRG